MVTWTRYLVVRWTLILFVNIGIKLRLVSNAVLVWNTHHIQQIVDELRAEGLDIPSEYLQKISALMFKHIQIYGTYHFEDI